MSDEKLKAKMLPLFARVLKGEAVDWGIFQVYEDFLYTHEKDDKGNPKFKRVLVLGYLHEEEDDDPCWQDFDGTIESFMDTWRDWRL